MERVTAVVHNAGRASGGIPRTRKRRNLGTFATREQAKQHERDVRFFKRRG